MNNLFINWKTSLAGLFVITLTMAGPVLDHYFPLSGLSWSNYTASIAALFGGGGLLLAKDSTTHSTSTEVAASTVEAAKKSVV